MYIFSFSYLDQARVSLTYMDPRCAPQMFRCLDERHQRGANLYTLVTRVSAMLSVGAPEGNKLQKFLEGGYKLTPSRTTPFCLFVWIFNTYTIHCFI